MLSTCVARQGKDRKALGYRSVVMRSNPATGHNYVVSLFI